MDKNLTDMSKAYTILRQAMFLSGWHHLYHKVRLSSDDVYNILYYSNMTNKQNFLLCQIIRGILFNQVPELYQLLK